MNNPDLFFDKANQIDDLIKLDKPSKEDQNILFQLISEESTERYFFTHLAYSKNPSWFPFLEERGYFVTPPSPIEVEGGIVNPQWPALNYLASISPLLAEDVFGVVENFQLQNASRMSILLGGFTKIHPEFAPRILKIILNWIEKGLQINDDLIALIMNWANSGQWESALILIDDVLTPQEESVTEEHRKSPYYSPRAKFRQFDYYIEQFLKIKLPELLEKHSNEILEILENKIIVALNIEGSLEKEKKSSFWRSSIEPSSQSMSMGGCKDILLDKSVDALQKLVKENYKIGEKKTNQYLGHPFSIFRRLAIHTIRVNEQLWPKYLDRLYTDPNYWEDISYYHEYWLFTHETFSALTSKKREAYLGRLLSDLPEDLDELEEDEVRSKRHWVYRRLWAIKNDLSNTSAQPIFEELQEQFGNLEPPEFFAFLTYSSGVRSGWVSPKSAVELAELSSDEVLTELKKPYKPGLTSFDEPTREGLATELGRAVEDMPTKFAGIAPFLVDEEIHPLYVYHALRGFSEAWKGEKSFNWDPVIKLCHKVSKTRETPSPDGTPTDMLPYYSEETYRGARRAVIELLETAIVNDDNALPHEYLEDIRDILLHLADDPNPSTDYEEEWGKKEGWGYLNLALNVVRGKAVNTLIQYALHLARVVNKDEIAKGLLPAGIRIEPQILEKLTEKLDKELDPSKAVHSNFGVFLPNLNYLDTDWTTKNLEKIFPRDQESIEYWQAAWEGYMWIGNFYSSLFSKLRPYYRYAVEQLENTPDSSKFSVDWKKRLATHLAFAYAYGDEPILKEDSLIPRFIEFASDELRGDFVDTLNPIKIPSALEADSEEWVRIKSFWLQRHEEIHKNPENHKKELAAFLLWVPHLPESLDEFYELIESSALIADDWHLGNFFEQMAKPDVVEKQISITTALFEKSLKRTDIEYYSFARREEVTTIIETAIRSDNAEVKEGAIRIINIYGERGDERYRYLLNEI